MIVAIDLDGVLAKEEKPYSKAVPIRRNIQLVNKLFSKGIKIIIYTSRYSKDKAVTTEWLKKNNVRYHRLKLSKPYYDFIVDDKAVTLEKLVKKLGNG